jgi:hypothetical protein
MSLLWHKMGFVVFMSPVMAANTPENLSNATRRTALVVARLMFYLGLILGMLLGAAAVTILFMEVVKFGTPAERWLTGGVFGGLAIMAFGFSAMGKARIDKLKAG